jgi:hypothetical protein
MSGGRLQQALGFRVYSLGLLRKTRDPQGETGSVSGSNLRSQIKNMRGHDIDDPPSSPPYPPQRAGNRGVRGTCASCSHRASAPHSPGLPHLRGSPWTPGSDRGQTLFKKTHGLRQRPDNPTFSPFYPLRTTPAICPSGRTLSTAPSLIASLGIPKTMQVSSS